MIGIYKVILMIRLSYQVIFKCKNSNRSFNYFLSMFFLTSYKFSDSKAQEKGAIILTDCTTKEDHKIDHRIMMPYLGFS